MADVKWNPYKPVGSESYLCDKDYAEEDECHSYPGCDQGVNPTEQLEECG